MKARGQILVGVLALLLVVIIIVPAMVLYVQNEAKWSLKAARSTNAFQLAEAAIDRGYQKVTESTATWRAILNGTEQTGYHFDVKYTDLGGGTYTISVTSGPDEQEVTIYGVGRDKNERDVRTLKVVYTNAVLGNVGLEGADGVTMTGANVDVEWGAVVSPKAIDIGNKLHPSYYSAADITVAGVIHGATDSHCDDPNCWWWHSYYPNVPPMPPLSFGFYQSSAALSGNDPCGNAYYQPGNYANNCDVTTGKTYYITGNWTDFRSSVIGNIIVLGDLVFSNGKQSAIPTYAAKIPKVAWKQYCNDWASYQAYDAGAVGQPSCFGSLNNTYRAVGKTFDISPAIRGLVYVGGNLTIPKGGGNSDLVHGVIIVQGVADIDSNSHAHIYYDPDVAMNTVTTSIVLSRVSWQEVATGWLGP